MTTATETRDETLPNLDETDFPENAKRMMRAGIHLFADKGFAGTSVREIVQAADVTNPMLYYYFDNKEGLYNTLLTYLFEHLEVRVSRQLEQATSLVEAVDRIILAHFEGCRRSPVALRFVYTVLFGPEHTAPSFDPLGARQEMIERVSAMFDLAAERGNFEPNEEFDSVYLTDLLFEMINQRLMRVLKEMETISDPETRRQRMRELTSPEAARQLRQFFFYGAGSPADSSSAPPPATDA